MLRQWEMAYFVVWMAVRFVDVKLEMRKSSNEV